MTTTLISGADARARTKAARRLVEAGHTVFFRARDLARGNTVAGELGATAVQLDVTDPASVTAAVGALGPAVGHLDVLLNNAGIAGEQQPPADATVDDLERVFAINVVGAARLLKECTPLLEASEVPNVVNLGSAVGSLTLNSRPEAPWSILAYPMSKAALNP